jgi:hypothetical protein
MKVVMIDAFKPEYLEYAPYLSSLTKKFQWGELEMPLGHEGGMEIFFRGGSNKLALIYKKENSSLRFIKYFIFLDKLGKIGRFIADSMINFPRFIRGYELFRTGNIPLKELWKFDFSVNKLFYKINGVDYIYIQDLDMIGHKYGTKSKEIIRGIKNVDEKLSKIKFDIILSDHGMIDIKKIISVPKTDSCLIDSDMARYWGEKPQFDSKDGKWIKWDDKKYGDHIFLANSGVLIMPNYWQGKVPVKAMHGYDGKDKEMKAIYILNKEGIKKNLNVEELHKIFLEIKNKKNENGK